MENFNFVPPPKQTLEQDDRPDAGIFADVAEKKEVTESDKQAALLLEQLEKGEATHFDARLVESLDAVKSNKDKSRILSFLIDKGLITLRSLGSKVAGVYGALEAGAMSQKYFAQRASQYLSDRFLIDPASVKALPSQAANSVSEAARSATEGMNPAVVNDFKDMFRSAKDALGDAAKATKDMITDAGGGDILKSGADILTSAKDAISSGTSKGVDATVDQVNQVVIQPTIDTTAEAAGWTTYLPAAAIGYLVTSGVVGGVAEVMKERKEETSFTRVQALIDKVWNFDPHEEPDPRLELIGTFKEISDSPDKKKYSFSKEEWLRFAAAAREARCSLLRDKTKAPEITLGIEKKGLEKKAAATELIIKAQEALAQEDIAFATEILAQYDEGLERDLQPFERRRALEKKLGSKLARYTKAFAHGALQGTGLPVVWKGVKMTAKAGRRLLPF
jgi:hypothetical protein